MVVESETPEVHAARRTALELLLSDHLGDCIAPCVSICPAHMNIPLMTRQIAAGKLRDAIITVKKDIALPAILGRICPAPCEKGCRRKEYDQPVAICLLKRYVADVDLVSKAPYLPECLPAKNQKVAIIGAGPAGLTAAWHLLQLGYACTLFDQNEKPGGTLRHDIPADILPHDVLDAEIQVIEKLSAEFILNNHINKSSFEEIKNTFDAVVLAIGKTQPAAVQAWNLPASETGIKINPKTQQTEIPSVFAAGSAVRELKLAVRAVADAKAAAYSFDQYLSGQSVTGPPKEFSTHIGKLQKGEIESFMEDVSSDSRQSASGEPANGFSDSQAQAESLRCLHCDCRKPDSCKLRIYTRRYQANPNRYRSDRRFFQQQSRHPEILFEPGKCIDCGLCVQICEKAKEPLGFTFIGRGFDVRVATPFNQPLSEALTRVACDCAAACPTAAISLKS
jgi:ferredoxin